MTIVLLLVAGLIVLTFGADLLIRGSSGLALRLGLSPLVVGLTVVAFGTSSPELAVSVTSALAGKSDVTLGNVVGSNIFNTLFIIGSCAALVPLVIADRLLRVDTPVMVATSLLLVAIALDGVVSRVDGVVLLLLLCGYMWMTIRSNRPRPVETLADEGLEKTRHTPIPKLLLLIVFGIVGLVAGAEMLLRGAVALGRVLGMSELVIALTIVAAGTSLPEVAASIMSSLKGHRDIAVGNVVGSNIFNILGVLGAGAVVNPVHVSTAALKLDIPVMVLAMLVCIPVFLSGKTVTRKEGATLLGYYVLYTSYVVLQAAQNAWAAVVWWLVIGFCLPVSIYLLLPERLRSRVGAKIRWLLVGPAGDPSL